MHKMIASFPGLPSGFASVVSAIGCGGEAASFWFAMERRAEFHLAGTCFFPRLASYRLGKIIKYGEVSNGVMLRLLV
jgi:hypothetical protein